MGILDEIAAAKRRDVAKRMARTPAATLRARLAHAPAVRDFIGALSAAPDVAVIAEVKKASPSAGVIRADFDPVAIGRTYETHGASGISVLTDERYFQGSFQYLSEIRAAVSVPVLCKDFLLTDYQVLEARVAGADAVLLIAELLEADELKRLLAAAHAVGMQALVELHDGAQLDKVLASGARLVGVNNRDLRTFRTDLEQTIRLAPRLTQAGRTLVSESGIRTREDVLRLARAGARAVLIGETLMRAPDIGARLDELRGRPS